MRSRRPPAVSCGAPAVLAALNVAACSGAQKAVVPARTEATAPRVWATPIPSERGWIHDCVQVTSDDDARYYLVRTLRVRVAGARVTTAEDAPGRSFVGVARLDDGWLFATADGVVFRAATFTGPLRVLGTQPAGVVSWRRPLPVFSRGRLATAVGDEAGEVWTTDGRSPPAPLRALPPARGVVFRSATDGVAQLDGGELARTLDGGATWRSFIEVILADAPAMLPDDPWNQRDEFGHVARSSAPSPRLYSLHWESPYASGVPEDDRDAIERAWRELLPLYAIRSGATLRADTTTVSLIPASGGAVLEVRRADDELVRRRNVPEGTELAYWGNDLVTLRQIYGSLLAVERVGADGGRAGLFAQSHPGGCVVPSTTSDTLLSWSLATRDAAECVWLIAAAAPSGADAEVSRWNLRHRRVTLRAGVVAEVRFGAPDADVYAAPTGARVVGLSWTPGGRVAILLSRGAEGADDARGSLVVTAPGEAAIEHALPAGTRSVAFRDDRRAVAAGATGPWQTDDCGATWTRVELPEEIALRDSATDPLAPPPLRSALRFGGDVRCAPDHCLVGGNMMLRWDDAVERATTRHVRNIPPRPTAAPEETRPVPHAIGYATVHCAVQGGGGEVPRLFAPEAPGMPWQRVVLHGEGVTAEVEIVEGAGHQENPALHDAVRIAWRGVDRDGAWRRETHVGLVPGWYRTDIPYPYMLVAGDRDHVFVQRCIHPHWPGGAPYQCSMLRGDAGGTVVDAEPRWSPEDAIVGFDQRATIPALGVAAGSARNVFGFADGSGAVSLVEFRTLDQRWGNAVFAQPGHRRQTLGFAERAGAWGYVTSDAGRRDRWWFHDMLGPAAMPVAIEVHGADEAPAGCVGPTPDGALRVFDPSGPTLHGALESDRRSGSRATIELRDGHACVRALEALRAEPYVFGPRDPARFSPPPYVGARDVRRVQVRVESIDETTLVGTLDDNTRWAPLRCVFERQAEVDSDDPRAVFRALRPGGVYGIVDHSAATGHGVDDARTFHRIEQRVVVDEVQAAGFRLDGEADFLRNPSDTRDWNDSPARPARAAAPATASCCASCGPRRRGQGARVSWCATHSGPHRRTVRVPPESVDGWSRAAMP